jgi:hypothetical protein
MLGRFDLHVFEAFSLWRACSGIQSRMVYACLQAVCGGRVCSVLAVHLEHAMYFVRLGLQMAA